MIKEDSVPEEQPYSIGWVVNQQSQIEFTQIQKLTTKLKEQFNIQIQILNWSGIESEFSFKNFEIDHFQLILLPKKLYACSNLNPIKPSPVTTPLWVGYSMETGTETPFIDLNNQDKPIILNLAKLSILEISQLLTQLCQRNFSTQASSSNPVKGSQKPKLKLMVNPDFQEPQEITQSILLDQLKLLLEEFQEKYFQAKFEIRKLDIEMKALEDKLSRGNPVDLTEIKELYLKIEAYNGRLKSWVVSLLKPVSEYKKSAPRKRRKPK